MSMEDILKVLVSSRQQGSSSQTADPMSELIGGLLGSALPQAQNSNQPAGGLGDMMGMLEMVMGGNQRGGVGQPSMGNDPVMMLLQPFVGKLANKANIPPEIAMIVVSFVAHKLLAHHPSSGRDSNSFDLDDMLRQMGSGKIDQTLLHNSGMVKEISKSTGLDESTAAKTLDAAFGLFGKRVQSTATPVAAKPTGPAKGGLKSSGAKGGAKAKRKN